MLDEIQFHVFENVYDSDELMCPWYPVTGNHDWGNNEDCGDAGNWTAQILYSWGFLFKILKI